VEKKNTMKVDHFAATSEFGAIYSRVHSITIGYLTICYGKAPSLIGESSENHINVPLSIQDGASQL
jgi:hypothetical protein